MCTVFCILTLLNAQLGNGFGETDENMAIEGKEGIQSTYGGHGKDGVIMSL